MSSLSCAMAGPLEFKGDDGEDAHRFRRHSEKRRSIDAGRQLCQRNAPQARIFRNRPEFEIGLPTSIPPSRTATNLSQHTRSARESPQHAPTAAGTQNSHNGLDRPCSRCSPT